MIILPFDRSDRNTLQKAAAMTANALSSPSVFVCVLLAPVHVLPSFVLTVYSGKKEQWERRERGIPSGSLFNNSFLS